MDCKHEIQPLIEINSGRVLGYICTICPDHWDKNEIVILTKAQHKLKDAVIEAGKKQVVYEILENYPNGDKQIRCEGCRVVMRLKKGTLFNSNEFPHATECTKNELEDALKAYDEGGSDE